MNLKYVANKIKEYSKNTFSLKKEGIDSIIRFSFFSLALFLPIVFLSNTYEQFDFPKQLILTILSGLALIAWLARMIFFEKKITIIFSLLDVPLLIFFFSVLLSAFFSVDKISSFLGFYGRFSDSILGLSALLTLYFVFINNRRLFERTKIINAILASSLVAEISGLLCLLDFWQKFPFLPETMRSPVFNTVGGSLESLAFFSAATLILSFFKKPPISYLFFGFSALTLLIIDFSYTWLVLALVFMVYLITELLLFKKRIPDLFFPCFIFLLSLIFFLFPLKTPNFPSEKLPSFSESYTIAIKSIAEKPLLGSGLATYSYNFSKYKPLTINPTEQQVRLDKAPSHFIEILSTLGILGFVSFLLPAFFFLWIEYKIFTKKKESVDKTIFFFWLFVFAAQFFYLQNTVMSFFFWLFTAMEVARWKDIGLNFFKEKTSNPAENEETKLVFAAIFFVFLIGFFQLCVFSGRSLLADIFFKASNPEKAIELNKYRYAYQAALAKEKLTLAEKYLQEKDYDNFKKNLDEAFYQAKGASSKGAHNIAVTEFLADIYYSISKLNFNSLDSQTKKLYEQAIDLEPTNHFLHLKLGKTILETAGEDKNNIEKAKSEFEKSLKIKPEYVEALYYLALVEEKIGNKEKAAILLEDFSARRPDFVEAIFELGKIYFNLDLNEKSIEKFKQAIKLQPNNSNARYGLAMAFEKKGKTKEALEELKEVLKWNPENKELQTRIKNLELLGEK